MMIALTIVSIIMLATMASLQREATSIGELQRLSYSERLIQDLFTKIEQRLDFGQGMDPTTMLATGLSAAGTGGMVVQESLGFPFEGTVIVEPGTVSEERIEFNGLAPSVSELTALTRGVDGTSSTSHPSNSLVLWEGISYPIEEQLAPAAGTFDGTTDDIRGPVFFRGDGVGFAYRRPVDPAGTGTFIDSGDIRWGATVGGADSVDGCACLVFSPIAVVTEAQRNFDINADGDLDDTFDLGGISDLAWNAFDPALGTSSLELVSPILLQEQDNYGGDMDGDGLDDPMFLWTPDSGRLRIRLFALLGDINSREVVKRFETVLYLRNGAAD
jgi:hypothetical protein